MPCCLRVAPKCCWACPKTTHTAKGAMLKFKRSYELEATASDSFPSLQGPRTEIWFKSGIFLFDDSVCHCGMRKSIVCYPLLLLSENPAMFSSSKASALFCFLFSYTSNLQQPGSCSLYNLTTSRFSLCLLPPLSPWFACWWMSGLCLKWNGDVYAKQPAAVPKESEFIFLPVVCVSLPCGQGLHGEWEIQVLIAREPLWI